jgi:hypothetical protein
VSIVLQPVRRGRAWRVVDVVVDATLGEHDLEEGPPLRVGGLRVRTKGMCWLMKMLESHHGGSYLHRRGADRATSGIVGVGGAAMAAAEQNDVQRNWEGSGKGSD